MIAILSSCSHKREYKSQITLLCLIISLAVGKVFRCTGEEARDYQPSQYAYNISTYPEQTIGALLVSGSENTYYGKGYDNYINGRTHLFKRDFEDTVLWEKFYEYMEGGDGGFILSESRRSLYNLSPGPTYHSVSKINSDDGSIANFVEFDDSITNGCDSIALTKNYLVTACLIESGSVVSTGIIVMNSSSLAIQTTYYGLASGSALNHISVHSLNRTFDQVFLAIHKDSLRLRRNLAEPTGAGQVTFGLFDLESEIAPWWQHQLVCNSNNDCSDTHYVRCLFTGYDDIYCAITVETENSLFFSLDRKTGSLISMRKPNYELKPQYVHSMATPKDQGTIYALVYHSQGTAIMEISIKDKLMTNFWQSTYLGLTTIQGKGGMFFLGGLIQANRPVVIKSVFSDHTVLGDLFSVIKEKSYSLVDVNQTSYSLTDSNDISFNSILYTNQSLSISEASITPTFDATYTGTSDLIFQSPLFEVMSLDSLVTTVIDPGVPCQLTGTLTYEFVSQIWGEGDNWSSVSPSGDITVTPPVPSNNSTTQTKYMAFTINLSNGDSIRKTIVAKLSYSCDVSHCSLCVGGDSLTCETCEDGYFLSLDSHSCLSTFTQDTLTLLLQSIFITEFLAAFLSLIIGKGSSAAIWIMINQYQLVLATPLLGKFIPERLLLFFDAFRFTSLHLNWYPDTPFDSYIESTDYPQPYDELKRIGYSSGSSLVNEFSTCLWFAFVIVLNILALILVAILSCSKRSCSKWISSKIKDFFGLALYARLLLEVHFFLLLAASSELEVGVENHISYAFAGVLVTLSLSIIILVFIHWLKYSKNADFLIKTSKVKEMYSSFKPHRCSLAYHVAYFFRRLAIVAVLVGMRNMPMVTRVVIYSAIQLLAFVYLISVRPFLHKKDTLMEIINEVVFLFFLTLTSFEVMEWTERTVDIVIITFIANGFIVATIIISNLLYQLVKKGIKACRKKKKITKVIPMRIEKKRPTAPDGISHYISYLNEMKKDSSTMDDTERKIDLSMRSIYLSPNRGNIALPNNMIIQNKPEELKKVTHSKFMNDIMKSKKRGSNVNKIIRQLRVPKSKYPST